MTGNTFLILVVAACLVVLIVLMIGLQFYVRGGDANKKYGNRLMRYRIIAQAVAVLVILALAAFFGTR